MNAEQRSVDIKYHLDEHIDPAIAAGLRQRGIDVTTTLEAGLAGASDTRQLAFASAANRVLVTCDSDLLVLADAGAAHAGIAFWPSRERRLGQVVLDLALLARVASAADMEGRVEFL